MYRTFVLLVGVIFALYGIGFVAAPAALFEFVTGGLLAAGSVAIDVRATYGGMSIGAGALLIVLSRRDSTLQAGLTGVALLMLSMAAGRSVGMIVDGSANTVMVVYLALEIVAAAIALRGLRHLAGQ